MPPKLTVLHGYTRLPIEADKILTEAVGVLESCLVLGECLDGDLYAAGTSSDKGEILFL